MIRINLLGVPRTKRGKRAAAVSTPGSGPSPILVGLFVIGITVLGLGYLYNKANNDHEKLQSDLQVAIRENQRLSTVKATYEKTQKEAEEFKRRVRVIDDLQSARTGPVDFLQQVANTINNTDAVWLQAMTDDGKNIDFTGTALSPNAVADLMVNLQKTGLFKTVEIKETSQDSAMKELQAFKFELICEKVSQQPTKPEKKAERSPVAAG
ncbi:MAG TPA: PilN domain-containing protein [Candidatus Solibacter sp.]|jgi:Tfp pilus assembly protein PilN|nr:PilN domain-containing protein [Candidatus Solibacter sp.]